MSNDELIKAGPGPRTAFLDKADAQSFAETMVAFANTEGGTMVIGIDDDGKPVSKKIGTESLETALKEADSFCNPPVVVGNWESLSLEEDQTAYTIQVPRSIELHALTDGRVLIRSGISNRPLGGQEILETGECQKYR